VLIADDDYDARSILCAVLESWGYQPIAARDGDEALARLLEPNGPTLALVDWMMPGLDGVDVIQKLRALRPEPYTYVILLTARALRRDVLQGLEAGADDYLVKPYDQLELRTRMQVGVRVVKAQAAVIEAREQLREQAKRDPLTGLHNRTAVMERLELELNRSKRTGCPVSVLLIDLDHFKAVNDQHGHLVGDEVLRGVAQRMAAAVRSYDMVGRYGGEEFLVVLPDTPLLDGRRLSERLLEAVSDPTATDEGPMRLSASIGLASTEGWGEDLSLEDLIRAADAAMYHAKDAGRGRIEVSPTPDTPKVVQLS